MKLLFASAEIYPYAKTGGLADVSGALPKALSKKIQIRTIMPLYDFIDRDRFEICPLDLSFELTLGDELHTISLYQASNSGVESLFIYSPLLSNRPHPYGDTHGDFPDNALRFGLFAKAIVQVAKIYDIDILHLNDWHTALSALWAKELTPEIKTVFTIHNLAFQGIFPHKYMKQLGLSDEHFTMEKIEFWGDINLLKAAIAYSARITTVSPKYADEILKPQCGCGLDGFLRLHKGKLQGILNGIDYELFDPKHDPALFENYDADSFDDKQNNKTHFCKKYNFSEPNRPLFVFISRLTEQKGIDILLESLPQLLKMKINIAILGDGSSKIVERLLDADSQYENFSFYNGFDESLSHQMYAAADFLLMPSAFEPCGLNQMIALRYGAIPIVSPVGGLYDTIRDYEDHESGICGQGIVVEVCESDNIHLAIKRAVALFRSKKRFGSIAQANMRCDHSFKKSALRYLELYNEILMLS